MSGGRDDDVGGCGRRADVDVWLVALKDGFRSGDPTAVEDALAFLEEDPYFFRSGYAREKVARWLARAPLAPKQRARARDVASPPSTDNAIARTRESEG